MIWSLLPKRYRILRPSHGDVDLIEDVNIAVSQGGSDPIEKYAKYMHYTFSIGKDSYPAI